jgi:beta-N-acetylglucosaminidase
VLVFGFISKYEVFIMKILSLVRVRTGFLPVLLALLLAFSLPGLAYAQTAEDAEGAESAVSGVDTASDTDAAEAGDPSEADSPEYLPEPTSSDEQPASEDPEEADETEGVVFASLDSVYDGAVVTLGFNTARSQLIELPLQAAPNGVQAALNAANSTPMQRFRLSLQSDGFYSIINIRSGLALDVFGSSAREGAKVIQWPSHGGDNQKWGFAANSDGSYTIVSKLNSSLCIDATGGRFVDGTPLVLWSRGTDKPNQRFWLSRIQPAVGDGAYTVRAASGATLLDIEANSQVSGARALTYSPTGGLNQRLVFTWEPGTGYYTIAALHSMKLLDVEGNGAAPGTSVIQWDGTGNFNQRWSLERDAQRNNLFIRAASSGQALDVFGGSASSGARVIVWPLHGKANQQWVLSPTDVIDEGVYSLNVSTTAWLDVYGKFTANGTRILTYTRTSNMNQRFFLARVSPGVYTIEDLNSNKYLTRASTSSANVVLYEWQNSDTQKWRILPVGGGRFALQSMTAGGMALTADSLGGGGDVSLASLGSSGTQKWQFVATEPINEGLYVFASALNSGFALDIPGGARTEGLGLTLWTLKENPPQTFLVKQVSGGYYRLTNLSSGMAWDIYGSALNATNGSGSVIQWPVKPGNPANQLWRLEYVGGGALRFVSALQGDRACLTVMSGQAADSAVVGVLDKNGSPAQAFYPKKVANATYENLDITLAQMAAIQKAQTGGTVYSNGVAWVTASSAQVVSALDPAQQGDRMMQFVDLRIPTGLNGAQLDAYIASGSDPRSLFRGMGATFVAAANQYGINEAYFLSHAINETGWGKYVCGDAAFQGFYYDGRTKVNGQYYPAGIYYNFWGIGAYDSNALTGGQNYAVSHGWNSPSAAIYGSAKWISENYIYFGQPTGADMRWAYTDCSSRGSASGHKYATDINWARAAARLMQNLYSSTGTPELYYLIPAYAG